MENDSEYSPGNIPLQAKYTAKSRAENVVGARVRKTIAPTPSITRKLTSRQTMCYQARQANHYPFDAFGADSRKLPCLLSYS